jgi:lysophospholipase L1-like esterase
VGDSVTFATGQPRGYPVQLQILLGKEWQVGNFGCSGATLLNKGDRPYQKQATFQKAITFEPDVVVIMLGTNDTKAQNWKLKDQFVADYKDLIGKFRALPTHPKIYVCLPTTVFGEGNFGITDAVLQEQMPMIVAMAKQEQLPVIDNHKITEDKDAWFFDRVHPTMAGGQALAIHIYESLIGKPAPVEKLKRAP